MTADELTLKLTLILTLLVMLLGLLGGVLLGLPGVPLILFAPLVYAYLTGFEIVGAGILVLLGVFALVDFDFLAKSYDGARKFRAGNRGTVGAWEASWAPS